MMNHNSQRQSRHKTPANRGRKSRKRCQSETPSPKKSGHPKKKRRRCKSVSRRRKKSKNSYGQGGHGREYFSATKDKKRIALNQSRIKSRKIKKQKDQEWQDKMNKAMQQNNDEIIARQLEKEEREQVSSEIINATLDQNQKLLVQKRKLQQMLQMKDDEIETLWDRLHQYIQWKRDENDPDFLYMEETGVELNENEQKEESQLTTNGIILYKINSYVFSAQVVWRFVMIYQMTLALITSTNDLIEGLIGAVKFLFFGNTKYNYKTCGTLLSFARNETYTNVINNNDLNLKAQNELFNVLPSHRTLEQTLCEQHKSECLNAFNYKVIQNEKEIKKKQNTQQRELQMYNKWITCDFKQSKRELLEAMADFIRHKRNKYSAKVEFMTNLLRKFKYCTKESIVLNDYDFEDNLEDIKVAVFELCEKYDVWGEAIAWNEAKDNELSRITTPTSLFNH